MEDNQPTPTNTLPPVPTLTPEEARQRLTTRLILIGIAVVVVAVFILAVYFLARTDIDTTTRIRDIFIIFMALESLVIGLALVILVVQLSTLINLLRNEIKPLLDSTNETVNTVRGTVTFLSDNLAEPVIKLNEYMAAVKRIVDFIRPPRRGA